MEEKETLTKTNRRPILRVGYLPTLYHTSFILKAEALLERHGVETQWTLFASGPDVVDAIGSARIDLGYIGLPPVILGIDRGVRITCVAGGHIEGTTMVAREAVNPLDHCANMAEFLTQFVGSTIGCPPGGSIHDVIIRELLVEHNVKGVRVRNYAWADFLPDALVKREIAAAVGTPALAVAAERYYDVRMVAEPSKFWPYNPSYGIVATEKILHNRGMLRTFLTVHEAACQLIRQDPRACARIVAQSVRVVDEEFIKEAYKISPKYCASVPSQYIQSTMQFVVALRGLGYISRYVDKDEIFNLSLINKVHQAPPHYELGINA
ncbi:MAG: ABC transporter substrate-binding protein [Halobacteriota archaeon]